MKATLQFDLPEDQAEFELANHAEDWHGAVWEIDQKLRGALKHGHSYSSADDAIGDIRKLLYEELNGRGLQLH